MSSATADVLSYINSLPDKMQRIAQELRLVILETMPQAEETIRYGIPTYVLNGQNAVHFGVYAKHIGFHPTPGVISQFVKRAGWLHLGKGLCAIPI